MGKNEQNRPTDEKHVEEARKILLSMIANRIIDETNGNVHEVQTSKGIFHFEVNFETKEAFYINNKENK